MSDATQVAIITGIVGIIIGIVSIIGQQIHDRNVSRDHHRDNTHNIEDLKTDVKALKKELPDGGLSTWIETVRSNTKALQDQAVATQALAASLSELKTTVSRHDSMFAELLGGNGHDANRY